MRMKQDAGKVRSPLLDNKHGLFEVDAIYCTYVDSQLRNLGLGDEK